MLAILLQRRPTQSKNSMTFGFDTKLQLQQQSRQTRATDCRISLNDGIADSMRLVRRGTEARPARRLSASLTPGAGSKLW
jgi:hypothetical protein